MKKLVSVLFAVIFAVVLISSGCQSSADKFNTEQKEINDKLATANEALKDSIQQFKKEYEQKIINNEKIIADFKVSISKQKKKDRALYEKKLADLEKRNRDIKTRLQDFKDVEKDKWGVFKKEFGHDMDELGEAFKDLTVNNVK